MSSESELPSKPSTSKTYSGSCHCGANTFTVPISPPLEDPETTVLNCNCSICAKNGSLLVFVPAASINWIKGNFLPSSPSPISSSQSMSLPSIAPHSSRPSPPLCLDLLSLPVAYFTLRRSHTPNPLRLQQKDRKPLLLPDLRQLIRSRNG